MTIFSKSFAEYIQFQKVLFGVTLAVGLIRLVLSLAGADAIARFFSMNVMALVGLVLFPIMVYTKAFGGYKQVLVLLSLQQVLIGGVITLGIAIALVTGSSNVFVTGEEVGSAGAEIGHAASHLIGGPILGLVLWLPASIILFITKRAVSTPA